MRLKLILGMMLVCAVSAVAQETVSYKPNIHGTIRARWEMETETGDNRFQVKNARLSIDGKIAPSIDYFLNTDLCDCGKIKILDAWARMNAVDGLSFQAGQFRIPFGVDPFRAPHTYFFANRSYVGKQVCNYRAVGAEAAYSFSKIPLSVKAGVFNPTSIGDHNVWCRKMAYGGKAEYKLGDVKLSAGMMSIMPDMIRVNITDGAVTWSRDRWIVEGEYMYKHYTGNNHDGCHAYNLYADYHLPVKAGVFNRLSFQGRVDGMTAHSNGYRNDNGKLVTNDPARNRVTLGSTISYRRNIVFADLRVNYEKTFYHSGVDAPQGDGDKVLVELVLRF